MKTKTIEIEVFYDKESKPVCTSLFRRFLDTPINDDRCRFLLSDNDSPVCSYLDVFLNNDGDHVWPDYDCPLHGGDNEKND